MTSLRHPSDDPPNNIADLLKLTRAQPTPIDCCGEFVFTLRACSDCFFVTIDSQTRVDLAGSAGVPGAAGGLDVLPHVAGSFVAADTKCAATEAQGADFLQRSNAGFQREHEGQNATRE